MRFAMALIALLSGGGKDEILRLISSSRFGSSDGSVDWSEVVVVGTLAG